MADAARLLRRAGQGQGGHPEAVFVFYPGRLACVPGAVRAGRTQGQVPLYTVFTVDAISLPLQKDLALGVPGAEELVTDLDRRNKKFVADFMKKYPAPTRRSTPPNRTTPPI